MKVFLKHIWRTFRSHPAQPIMIILTVALAVCVGTVALRFRDVFLEHNKDEERKQRARADIMITLSAESEERMLFSEDVAALLGDRAQVLGDYSLTAFYAEDGNTRPVALKAVSLEDADKYYDLDFFGYGEFTDKNLSEAVVISKKFSEQNGLYVGDRLSLSVLDINKEYIVQAVADDEVCFSDCDILIDISSATKLLAQRSKAIASLGDSFVPSNRIMIRLYDASQTNEIFEMLSGREEFSDDRVQNMRANLAKDIKLLVQNTLISLMAVLICILSAIVIFTSISLLSRQREMEYALFAVSGADRMHIGGLKMLEGMIYAVVGGGAGLIISPFALDSAASLFSWYKGGARIGVGGIIFGFAFAILLMGGCTMAEVIRADRTELALRLSTGGYRQSQKKKAVLPAVFCIIFVALAVCAVAVDVEKKYIFSVAAVIIGIMALYFVVPFIFRAIAGAFERALSGSRAGILLICAKNVKNNYSLQHIGRLLTVLITVLIAIGICGGVVSEQETMIRNALSADIVVSEMPHKLREEIKEQGIAEGIAEFEIHRSAEIAGKYSVLGISVSGDAHTCMSDELLPEVLPLKGQIVISKGLAYLCGVRVGDMLPLCIQGNEYKLEVSQIQNTNANIIFVNREDVSSSAGVVCIDIADGKSREDTINLLEAEGVMAWSMNIADMIELDTLNGFLALSRTVIFASLAVSLVGCINMYFEQKRQRFKEREILRLSGMEKARLSGMTALEMIFLSAVSLLLAAVSGAGICFIIDLGLRSFGCVLF